MSAYEYTGIAPTNYPWGVVKPGDIAYFGPGSRPPDGDWAIHVPAAPAPEQVVGEAGPELSVLPEGDEVAAGGPARPNKAASAEDWKAFAVADGSFQEATGTHPDEATRRAIVDHYTAGQPDEAASQ